MFYRTMQSEEASSGSKNLLMKWVKFLLSITTTNKPFYVLQSTFYLFYYFILSSNMILIKNKVHWPHHIFMGFMSSIVSMGFHGFV